MEDIKLYTYLFLILLCIKEIATLFEMQNSLSFYTNIHSELDDSDDSVTIFVIISVLREQKVIEDTVKYFNSLKYHRLKLILVTSEKEVITSSNSPTTIDVIKSLKNKYDFCWIHYPKIEGLKSDQINYAVNTIPYLFPNDIIENSFIAIYDVDSRPNPETFTQFNRVLTLYPDNNIFQQSSLFYRNFNKNNDKKNYFAEAFLQAQGLRATRFVLGYEIPRFINQLSFYNKKNFLRSFIGCITYAHCVGHGLFIRFSFSRLVPFPPNSVLEDMYYGFILNYLREPIIPIPVLTNSDVPDTIYQTFMQNSRWFLGPSRCLSYFQYSMKKYPKSKFEIRDIGLVLFGYYATIMWMFTSLVIGGALLYLIMSLFHIINTDTLTLILAATFLFIYLLGGAFLLANQNNLADLVHDLSLRSIPFSRKLKIMIGFIMVLLFHSFPTYYTIYESLFNGLNIIKNTKTER